MCCITKRRKVNERTVASNCGRPDIFPENFSDVRPGPCWYASIHPVAMGRVVVSKTVRGTFIKILLPGGSGGRSPPRDPRKVWKASRLFGEVQYMSYSECATHDSQEIDGRQNRAKKLAIQGLNFLIGSVLIGIRPVGDIC